MDDTGGDADEEDTNAEANKGSFSLVFYRNLSPIVLCSRGCQKSGTTHCKQEGNLSTEQDLSL
jgi:hypothetical protein